MLLPNPELPWPIVWEGVELIAEKESCLLEAYLCPAGYWTCGWGEREGVDESTKWTQEYADYRFCTSLTKRADLVRAACTLPPVPHELAAMTSLMYNIGLGWKGSEPPPGAKDGFLQSTVLRLHNKGELRGAALAFRLWNKMNGEFSQGLFNRRKKEAKLYVNDDVVWNSIVDQFVR
jgi:lysozyme